MIRTNSSPLLWGTTATVAVFLLWGCSPDLPTRESTSATVELKTETNAASQNALLFKLGRGLAVALADPATRAWVRSRIDASPYVEWRIPFRDVLVRESGLPAMRRVLDGAKLTATERNQLRALPDLELYLPIRQHRASWKASDAAQVAVRIGHSETYQLYASDGTMSVTRGNYVPRTATLVLARSEIDYRDHASAIRGGKHTGPGMEAIAQALPPPEEEPPPPPPSGGVTTSRHSRLGYFRTTQYHDDFFGGTDEVEIFGSVMGGYKDCTWRTDVSPGRDYYLDLANSFYTIAAAIPWGTATLFLRAMEDDEDRCVLRGSDDNYGSTWLKIEHYGIITGTSNPGHISVRVHSVVP